MQRPWEMATVSLVVLQIIDLANHGIIMRIINLGSRVKENVLLYFGRVLLI